MHPAYVHNGGPASLKLQVAKGARFFAQRLADDGHRQPMAFFGLILRESNSFGHSGAGFCHSAKQRHRPGGYRTALKFLATAGVAKQSALRHSVSIFALDLYGCRADTAFCQVGEQSDNLQQSDLESHNG